MNNRIRAKDSRRAPHLERLSGKPAEAKILDTASGPRVASRARLLDGSRPSARQPEGFFVGLQCPCGANGGCSERALTGSAPATRVQARSAPDVLLSTYALEGTHHYANTRESQRD